MNTFVVLIVALVISGIGFCGVVPSYAADPKAKNAGKSQNREPKEDGWYHLKPDVEVPSKIDAARDQWTPIIKLKKGEVCRIRAGGLWDPLKSSNLKAEGLRGTPGDGAFVAPGKPEGALLVRVGTDIRLFSKHPPPPQDMNGGVYEMDIIGPGVISMICNDAIGEKAHLNRAEEGVADIIYGVTGLPSERSRSIMVGISKLYKKEKGNGFGDNTGHMNIEVFVKTPQKK